MIFRLLANDSIVWQGRNMPMSVDFEKTIESLKRPEGISERISISLDIEAKRILGRPTIYSHGRPRYNICTDIDNSLDKVSIRYCRNPKTYIVRCPIDIVLHHSIVSAHFRNYAPDSHPYVYNIEPISSAELNFRTDVKCFLNIHGDAFTWFRIHAMGHAIITFRGFQFETSRTSDVIFIKLRPGLFVCHNGDTWSRLDCMRSRPFILLPWMRSHLDKTFSDFYGTYRMRYFYINPIRYINLPYHRRVIIARRSD